MINGVRISWSVAAGRRGASRPITYGEFVERVRRYPRTSLLRALAAASAELEDARARDAESNQGPAVQPFTIAGVARVALRGANEYRNATVDASVVRALCSDLINVEDPAIIGEGIPPAGLERLLARMAHEQFAYQQSPMENVARSVALFLEHHEGVRNAPTPEQWREVLGVSLEQYMNVGFVAYAMMVRKEGVISRATILSPEWAPVWAPVGAGTAMSVLDRHFVTDLSSARDQAVSAERPGYERWSFNPLQKWPLLAVDGDLIAPSAYFVLEKITPTSLYFVGSDTWGPRFTTALGGMFERYVGTHLQLIAGAQVYPEIVYGSPERKSCDYIAVFDDLVMLVEAKAARPAIDVRMGTDSDAEDLGRKISHARCQLEETARLIREGHPQFARIPADRELIGLIVTLEPFHPQQTLLNERLLDSDVLPIAAASAHELEGTVAGLQTVPDVAARLRQAIGHGDPARRNLGSAAADDRTSRNPILDAAWDRWYAAGPGGTGRSPR